MRRPHFSIASLLAVIGILGVALAALLNPSYLWANVTFSMAFAAIVLAIINTVYGREARRAYWLGFSLCGGIYFAACSVPGLHDSLCPRLATEAIFDFLYPHLAPPMTTPPQNVRMQRMLSARAQMMNQMVSQVRGRAGGMGGMGGGMGGMGGGMGGMGGGMGGLGGGMGGGMMGGGRGGRGGMVAVAPPAPESRWSAWTEPDRETGVGDQIGTVSLVSSDAFRQIGHSLVTLLAAALGGVYARNRYEAWAARDASQVPHDPVLA